VPTLVVPLEKTLAPELENRYKAITDSIAIVEFLDKSRSATSRTRSTSSAPAPALAPATVALLDPSKRIIELVHGDAASPNIAFYMSSLDDASLKSAGPSLGSYYASRREALVRCLEDNEKAVVKVSEKTKRYWEEKLQSTSELKSVFGEAEKAKEELGLEGQTRRDEHLSKSKVFWETMVKRTLVTIDTEMIGPFALGDQLSIADLHLGVYIARLVHLSGGDASNAGDEAVAKLEAKIGGQEFAKEFLVLAVDSEKQATPTGGTGLADTARKQSKLAAFWDAMKERPSWQKVYEDGLF